MRLQCFFCAKSVSNEVPEDTVVRAIMVCPECMEEGWVVIQNPKTKEAS